MADSTSRSNDLGQPIGPAVPDWRGARMPPDDPMEGRTVRIELLDPDARAEELFEAFSLDREGRLWTYLPCGPFATASDLRAEMRRLCERPDEQQMVHAIVDLERGAATGIASYLRVDAESGTIEIGWICMSPLLQQSVQATEAMYLMARRVFDELGYRRYEWKCDAMNAGSMRAAKRLGFTYEGTFRQDRVYRGRNRDTAWYSMIDSEWPALRSAYESWLTPANFDEHGQQREPLSRFMEQARQRIAKGA